MEEPQMVQREPRGPGANRLQETIRLGERCEARRLHGVPVNTLFSGVCSVRPSASEFPESFTAVARAEALQRVGTDVLRYETD